MLGCGSAASTSCRVPHQGRSSDRSAEARRLTQSVQVPKQASSPTEGRSVAWNCRTQRRQGPPKFMGRAFTASGEHPMHFLQGPGKIANPTVASAATRLARRLPFLSTFLQFQLSSDVTGAKSAASNVRRHKTLSLLKPLPGTRTSTAFTLNSRHNPVDLETSEFYD